MRQNRTSLISPSSHRPPRSQVSLLVALFDFFALPRIRLLLAHLSIYIGQNYL